MDELLPCPFCGTEAAERDFAEPFVNGWVGCQACHCFINWVKNGKQQAITAWNRRAKPENEPLTLDQLKQMNGDPVWVVSLFDNQGKWCLVDGGEKCVMFTFGRFDSFRNYGKTWLAYRYRKDVD